MARSTRKLDELAALLEKTGGDPVRLEAVRRTQNFRRSWLDLAETLSGIRSTRSYTKWGYEDLYAYAHAELTLKRATVDKLTLSFSTLSRHAPQVLKRDGVAKTIPSYEAIDYYSRVVGDDSDDAANETARRGPKARRVTPERVAALTDAVFEEGRPVGEIRKQFDPVFFPKPKGSDDLATIAKAAALAGRLAEILPDVPGMPQKQVREVEKQLGQLRIALDELAKPLKEKVAAQRKQERAKSARAPKGSPDKTAKAKAPPRPKAPRVQSTGG